MAPSTTTVVSAPSTVASAGLKRRATSADFSAARRRTYAAGVSPARTRSSTSAAATSKVNPAARNSSERRGDAEARTSRMHANDKMNLVRSLQHVMPTALLTLLRDAPLSSGKVGFAWRAAVGPALERATRVKLDARVLIVETDSPQWSREVMRSSPVILRRLQEFLGEQAVERIEVRRA